MSMLDKVAELAAKKAEIEASLAETIPAATGGRVRVLVQVVRGSCIVVRGFVTIAEPEQGGEGGAPAAST